MVYKPPATLVREQQIGPMRYTAAMLEKMVYGGVTYTRDLENENKGAHYWQAPRGSGLPSLHRRVYEETYGPIPDGYHVHHVDFDTTNNRPSNLVALSPSEHRKVHPGYDNRAPEHLARLDAIRPASHESARRNGLYSRISKEYWAKFTPQERSQMVSDRWKKVKTKIKTCVWCGSEFTAKRSTAKFCSSTCRSSKTRSKR